MTSATPRKPRAREKTLRPIHPNAGIAAEYSRRINRLIDDFERSTLYFIKAAYRASPPEMARDESPAAALRSVIAALRRRWLARFADAAKNLADYFAKAVNDRSKAALKKILKDSGIAVPFRMSRAQNDVLQSVIFENVSLIKSIPSSALHKVEGHVMRAIQSGHDLETLTKALQKDFGVSKKRAIFIARDQNSKATGALTRARYLEIGIDQAVWLHSGGGRKPRPSHVKAGRDKIRYDVDKGWFDPDEKKYIQPGELINCRCVCKPVLAGLS